MAISTMKRSTKAPRRAKRAKARGRKASARRRSPSNKWSKLVTETSNALDLEASVFKRGARAIAASLKRSAERSRRRRTAPFRSAMSMLSFYINRGGRNLSPAQRRKLEQAKKELRSLFGKRRASER
jgi:hypothetical protein